jgi:hypothetical protein
MTSSAAEESSAVLDACLEGLRAEARLFGARVRALFRLDALADASRTRRFLELEVAGSLSVGQLTASRWLAQAERFDEAAHGVSPALRFRLEVAA